MTLALAVVFLLSPQSSSPNSVETMQIAMTRDGVRLEVLETPEIGALDISTEFGVFHSALDPVAVVLKSPRGSLWREELKADPDHALMPSIERFDSDGRISELLGMIPVLEGRLSEDEFGAAAEDRNDELIAVCKALSRWGAQLDPLPSKLKREERIKQLWKRARSAEGATALLVGSRLLSEVEPGGHGIGDYQLSQSDLENGMRSRNPYLRGMAAQISARQLVLESSFNAKILIASIEDKHVVARNGAAIGAFESWPRDSSNFWAHVLGSAGDGNERIRAARSLAGRRTKEAHRALSYALAWRGQPHATRVSKPDIRRLAQMAARDFGVTAAELDRERFDARHGTRVLIDRLVRRTAPRAKMTDRLEAAVRRELRGLLEGP